MPIQENALNAALAAALADHALHATPEETRQTTGGKRCDVQIRRRHGDRYFAALECKIGQSATQKQAAIKDAQRWLRESECWNALALCYPEELTEDRPDTSQRRLAQASDLMMVRVNRAGPVGRWRTGGLADLATLADDVGANETHAITDILQRAILAASDRIDGPTGQALAGILHLPWDPKSGHGRDPRPGRIACLIVANTALLQNRMHSAGVAIKDLDTLVAVRDAASTQTALLDNWRRIRAVDYAPVVDPALAVLETLPADHHTASLLAILIDAVFDCVPRIHGLQLDHAGPLYHGLLQTARYDGSFYTSPAAAVLLAGLALPPDWTPVGGDWTDPDRLIGLKICDPACGTGTLLMAAARTLEERHRAGGGTATDSAVLHLGLIEDVLHGLDINQHAIHLAASMLTLSAPTIDYNTMHLYNMQHGVNDRGAVRAGSLDILVDEARYLQGLAPDTRQHRATATGYADEAPDLVGACDLVIMNPPFTRNDIRNRSLATPDRRQVQEREIELAANAADPLHQAAIDQSTIGTFFTPIADRLLNRQGTVAIVKPFTACTNASGKGERALLTDPDRFQLELVVTSHDNRRIAFSENTNIHESLIIARRPTPGAEPGPTAFVSLADNPTSPSEAHFLAEAITAALAGDRTRLAQYGNIAWRTPAQLRDRPWTAACFYDPSLAEDYDAMQAHPALAPLGNLAAVEPAGQRVRDAFRAADQRQSPDMRALWKHTSARQTTLRTGPDTFLVAKPGKARYAHHLWSKRGHLLLANRMWLALTRTPAVFADDPILGSAFVPAIPFADDPVRVSKAWCVWLNSTPGILAVLNTRQKKLTYPSFSLDGLRSLPVPRPGATDIALLVAAHDRHADSPPAAPARDQHRSRAPGPG